MPPKFDSDDLYDPEDDDDYEDDEYWDEAAEYDDEPVVSAQPKVTVRDRRHEVGGIISGLGRAQLITALPRCLQPKSHSQAASGGSCLAQTLCGPPPKLPGGKIQPGGTSP